MDENKLIPIALVGIGGYLLWFAIHYWARGGWPTTPVKSVLQGKGVPSAQTTTTTSLSSDVQAEEVAVDSWSTSSDKGGSGSGIQTAAAVSATGSAISDDALKYKGQGYVWGGNASSPGDWDCSSFVSYVLGHDLGHALPGGKWGDPGFPPNSHGPTTVQYMLFGTGINLSQVQAGDLVVSTEHIGIAISPTQMISAQDPQLGTNIGNFPGGFPSGPPIYRRVTG